MTKFDFDEKKVLDDRILDIFLFLAPRSLFEYLAIVFNIAFVDNKFANKLDGKIIIIILDYA